MFPVLKTSPWAFGGIFTALKSWIYFLELTSHCITDHAMPRCIGPQNKLEIIMEGNDVSCLFPLNMKLLQENHGREAYQRHRQVVQESELMRLKGYSLKISSSFGRNLHISAQQFF